MILARMLALTLVGVGLAAQGAPGKAAGAAQQTNAPAAVVQAEIPLSVFVIPANAKEGRNPFFPHSIEALPIPRTKATAATPETYALVLNGVTSRPTPTVMINGVTFGTGEEHEVKLAGGTKVKVRCEEIREASAVVLVNGTLRQELRLRAGL